MSNAGTIATLTNSGAISGGRASTFASAASEAARGGDGVSNAGTITTLTNSGTISGGGGKRSGLDPASAAPAVYNAGAITTLTNSGAIGGGVGVSNAGTDRDAQQRRRDQRHDRRRR